MKTILYISAFLAMIGLAYGQWIIKPDNNGVTDFNSALAVQFQKAIDSIRIKYLTNSGISAAVMIPGKGTWLGVSGFSKVDPMDSVRHDMLFHIESNTKGFVATVILQLAEEGKLRLDDSIGTYLPSFQNVSGKITIRQLLSMRSGLYDYANDSREAMDSIIATPDRIWTPEEVIQKFVKRFKRQPGGPWSYCNTNLLLAGMIVRDVTQSTLSSQIRRRILDTLRMTRTFFPVEEPALSPIANAWDNGVDNNFYFGNAHNSMSWAAGALIATAEDAVKWPHALYTGQLLSPASQKELLTLVPITPPATGVDGITYSGYGLCVLDFSFLGKHFWGHSGGAPGFSSYILYHPETGMCIAVLLNSRSTDVNPTGESVSALLHEYFKTLPAANASAGKSFVFGGDTTRMYHLDLTSSTITPIGKTRYGTILNCRIRPGTNELYGISNALGNEVVQIDGVTGEAYPRQVISFPAGIPNVKGMAFQSKDTLYIGSYDGRIFMINMQTGFATLVDTTGINIGGIDFNPKTKELWASVRSTTGEKDRIYKISLPSCDTLRVGVTGFNEITQDIAFDPSGNLYGLIGSGAGINRFAQIDTALGTGRIIGSFGISYLTSFALPTTITSVASRTSHPTQFYCSQNYPNPFNPSTTIRYALPYSFHVKLTIYDLLGREIAVLINEEQTAGWKEVDWKASTVSSGVYFYTLQAGEFRMTKSMVVTK